MDLKSGLECTAKTPKLGSLDISQNQNWISSGFQEVFNLLNWAPAFFNWKPDGNGQWSYMCYCKSSDSGTNLI